MQNAIPSNDQDPDFDSLAPERTCFVICSIGDEGSQARVRANQVLEHVIRPAAEANNLVPVRSDQISKPGMITTQIIRHILNDAMVVADLSDHNSNVFYELALRHAFRKPIVQMIVDDQKIPLDVGGLRTVSYSLTRDGARRASEAVKKQMASAQAKGFESESPVTIAARLEELVRSD